MWCNMGRSTINQKVTGLIPGCSCPQAEVSLGETPNPKLPLTAVLCEWCVIEWLNEACSENILLLQNRNIMVTD